jgi:hypothetical protein
MHTRTTAAALLATVLAAGLTACGSSPKPEKPAATPTSQAATEQPSETPTPTPEQPKTLGEAWEWESDDGLSGSTTALSYKQGFHSVVSADEEFGTDGYVWAALEVKVCNDATSSEPISVSNVYWTLAYADGSVVEPSSSGYDDFPRPQFPMGDTTLRAGRCLRGKIVFPVPGGQRPEAAVYAPEGLDVPIEWAVPAK